MRTYLIVWCVCFMLFGAHVKPTPLNPKQPALLSFLAFVSRPVALVADRVRNDYKRIHRFTEQSAYVVFTFGMQEYEGFYRLHSILSTQWSQAGLLFQSVWGDIFCRLILAPWFYNSPMFRRVLACVLPLLYVYQAFSALFGLVPMVAQSLLTALLPLCRKELNVLYKVWRGPFLRRAVWGLGARRGSARGCCSGWVFQG